MAEKQARKEYYKNYKKAWIQKRRQQYTSITLMLSPTEISFLRNCAKQHRRSLTSFCKAVTLAYGKQVFVFPDLQLLHRIHEQLCLIYTQVETLMPGTNLSYAAIQEVLLKFASAEQQILERLKSPELLEQAISKAVKADPSIKIKLLSLINSLP